MAAPAKPTPDDSLITTYFGSIGSLFEETLKEKSELHWTDFGSIFFVGFLVLTYASAIPRLLAWAIPRAVHRDTVVILRESVQLHKWNEYFGVCIAVAILGFALFAYLDFRRDRKVSARLLSDSQFAFACCYGLIDELDHFRTNRLPHHVQGALRYWKQLHRHLEKWFMFRTGPEKLSRRLLMGPAAARRVSVLAKIDELEASFAWFALEAETERILLALSLLSSRTQDRLRDRRELAPIGDFLGDLAWYLYTRIPEVSSGSETEAKELQQVGKDRLLAFAQKVIALEPYKSHETPAARKAGIAKQIASAVYSATYVFSHENMFVCFAVWLLFFALLVALALWAAFHYIPGLKADSTIVSVGISAPLLASAAAVAVSRARADKR